MCASFSYVFPPRSSDVLQYVQHMNRIPDSATCYPWVSGNTSDLEEGFDEAAGATGSVLVTRIGDLSATSAYGYTYGIDFVGTAVRGDMDVRLLIAQAAGENKEYSTGISEVVFEGLGDETSVEVTVSSNLDNATFTDAIIEFM